ncbi:hypothetical protein [Hydrogenophaga sp.]|uniref:hypothetical protein n=1 Tax=Hydrogenophaga sp. TaxID=1904254 RepID=UPI00286E854A|nr:hypothetical protein [Hydrogenophaga sp.]
MGIFDAFKSTLSKYSSTLKGVREQIDRIEIEIEDIHFAPIAKEDVQSAFRSWVMSEGIEWRRLLGDRLSALRDQPIAMNDPERLAKSMHDHGLLLLGAMPGPGQVFFEPRLLQRSLIGMFEEPISKAIDAALDGLEWAPGAINLKDRQAKLKTLNEKLAELKATEAELVKQAMEVGIDPSGIEPGA